MNVVSSKSRRLRPTHLIVPEGSHRLRLSASSIIRFRPIASACTTCQPAKDDPLYCYQARPRIGMLSATS